MQVSTLIYRIMSAALALGTSVSVVNAQATDGVTADSVKIGLLVPITGASGPTGLGMAAGAEAYFADINAKGGIHGRKIVTMREDEACTAEAGIAGARKLIAQEKVFAIGLGGCSNSVLAYRNITNEAKVPMVITGASHNDITKEPNCCIFRTSLTAANEGRLQVNFANSIPNAKRIALVSQKDAWGLAKYQGAIERLKELGITPIADEELPPTQSDATAQVLRLAQLNPDVIVTVLFPQPTVVFLRAAHQYGLTKKPIILQTSINDLVDLNTKVGVPGALDNVYTVTFTKDPNGPEMGRWKDLLKRSFATAELGPYTMWGIIGAEVFAEGLKKAGPDLTREKFIAAVEQIQGMQSDMSFGPLNFSSTVKNGNTTGMFQKLKDGKMVDVGTSWKP
jgi:branched-chain amino acid transport system substrate-binding protein